MDIAFFLKVVKSMKNKSIIKMNNIEAKNYFLKSTSYCNIELPEYFDFSPLLIDIDSKLKGKRLSDYNSNVDIKKLDDVNCILLNNKDGQYAWRPYEIIHPAIYIQLVNDITEKENWNLICSRLKKLQNNKNIICCSLPFDNKENDSKKEIVLNWWKEFEQRSISLALEYEYIGCTDITNCYGSLYTHTIPWALHTKKVAKDSCSDKTLIGNIIDKSIQSMHYNQTNGIPQGSVLMDFIAEIVLSYADNELEKNLIKQGIKDYRILRYRDDYKIYAHEVSTINMILKSLTQVLSELNFKINSQKTLISNDIIDNSIKKDKIYSIENLSNDSVGIQKFLLLARNFVKIYSSSGTIVTILRNFYINKISKTKKNIPYAKEMISILVDIMIINPKTYGIASVIISKLLISFNKTEKNKVIKQIKIKFDKISNTNYLEIWLQRLTIVDDRNKKYKSSLCKKIYEDNNIWNSTWTTLLINENLIINRDKLNNINSVIDIGQVKSNDVYDY